MSMMELFTQEQAIEALETSLKTRDSFIEELHKLDNFIFFLKYFLNTGEALSMENFGLPGEDEDD